MSFRKEIKFNLNKLNLEKFLFWIEKEGAEKLHNKRIVNSIYFDNKKLSMYHDSVEGIIPRKKIRMRNYNKNNEFLFEKKISSQEGLLDSQYGLCKPKIKVSYLRSYFTFKSFRITLDQNINYFKFEKNHSSKFAYKDSEFVAEIKGKNLNQDFLDNYFPFTSIRFSKYCRGIDLINGYNK